MKKQIIKSLLYFMLFVDFLPKASATNLADNFEINFIDKNSVTITKNHYIEIDGKKSKLGENSIATFWNTQEGKKCLSEHISSDLLSSILKFWDSSEPLVKSSKKFAKLEGDEKQIEVTIEENIQVEHLDRNKAVFIIFKKVLLDGIYYNVGDPQIVSYENSSKGREVLSNEMPDPFYSFVIGVWEDKPDIPSDKSQIKQQSE